MFSLFLILKMRPGGRAIHSQQEQEARQEGGYGIEVAQPWHQQRLDLDALGGRRPLAVREVEALYLDSIAAAQRYIYIENQYFTSRRIADALGARLTVWPRAPRQTLVPAPGG
jgi:phosphatidylserine/phosphatidylglycerophosphate/cardiolipin synthase-like enzyme